MSSLYDHVGSHDYNVSLQTEVLGLSTTGQVDSPSDESDEENEQTPTQKPLSYRRRAQNAKLSERADTNVGDLSKPTPADLPDAELSIASLVAKQDAGVGTLDPREYQVELFERAKSENTIAVLDTGIHWTEPASPNTLSPNRVPGSGKTLIAVLLLKHIIENELIDRANGSPARISFFLVDSVTLAYQQAAVLRNNLDQNVAYFFGAMGTDLWNKQTWDKHFESNMVIVCTAEILNQCLLSSYIRMDQINLLIFDEAHHTKKEHPYARIIRDSYLKTNLAKRPRIFGMTASPIDTKGDIVLSATKLEVLLNSKIATTSKFTVLRQVVNRPVEKVWEYPKLDPPFATKLYQVMENRFGNINRAWVHALADDVLPKLEGSVRKLTDSKTSPQVSESAHKEVLRLQEASGVVKNHSFNSLDVPGELSPKVQLLCKELTKYYERPTGTKCIIFVQKRYTAKMLFDLFNTLEIPYLRPGLLIGVRSGDVVGMNVSFRQQFLALVKFRNGDINCLKFATSVAEEGLDIPDCNLVVRFDLYNTLIQYVQSRGRARHSNSIYASMIERYNADHEARLMEVRDAELVLKSFCETLPEDRILHGTDSDLDAIIQGEEEKRLFIIRATGAKLTYHSALAILARYASSLQYEKDTSAQVVYVVLPVNSNFVCEVILPEKSPVRGLTGSPSPKKSIAKQSAAFDTCVLLRKYKLLDEHFNSVYYKRLPAMRNARLAITSKHTNQYDMLPKPSLWSKQRGILPEKVYATAITFIPSKPLTRKHGGIVLFTREKLPEFPSFSIFLDEDVETTVTFENPEEAIQISSQELDYLTTFTLRVFCDVFHKTYDREPDKLPYWIGPARTNMSVKTTVLESLTDWELLHFVHENEEVPFSEIASPNELVGRFVFDKWDGRYRYFTIAVDNALHPSNPPPSFVPRRRFMESIMSYSLSGSKNARAGFLSKCNWNQPVLQVELVRLRRNLLDKMTDAEKEVETRSVVCIEPLKISTIPEQIAASCLAFPAIVSRLDAYLIALEGCETLQLTIRPEYALEAFTKDSDNTEEHRAEQIHVQRGMGKNYERLEFLGDCFLKMATSISLFAQKPDDDEFDYHVNRMCLICNKNLFNSALKKELYRYIRSRGFSRHTWYPDGLTLLHAAYVLPKYQTQRPDGFELDLGCKIEEKLGYHFKLEFLGDSLLDMVCVEDLFHRFPDRDPQWLTEHKMAMVSNKFLGALAVRLGFHTHLKHFSNPLQSQITHYAEDIQAAEIEGDGAVDYWMATIDPPKCLPDMVEAYLGAVFVDSNFRFEVVEDFFQRHVKSYFHDMTIYDTFANKHPTVRLSA
ncbi:Dicer-like protein 1 [Aspergillus hancockii]|nr:Dicer-like protein 1 [Aspergillus hancockii]